MSDTLIKHKEIWQKKKILRIIYFGWYKQIVDDLKSGSGKTVELGAGTGNFKEFKKDVIATDIISHEWLDMKFDAHVMPFKNGEVNNIVMIDVFHHLADPIRFFHEACRVLKRGGRIIMVEPYPSFVSKIIYKMFHPEPFLYNIDYFKKQRNNNKEPWDSNQAIPFLIFFKHLEKFNNLFNNKFKILIRRRISFTLYPLSGGFEHKQLIPDFLIPAFNFLEVLLIPLNRFLAFRCYIVIEKI